MLRTSPQNIAGVRDCADANHSKHKISLKSWGKPSKKTVSRFTARLSNREMKKVCDFIATLNDV